MIIKLWLPSHIEEKASDWLDTVWQEGGKSCPVNLEKKQLGRKYPG